ncbi:MAG TPA: histidine phosphatase family protein [Xanthomonadaceae bacterium]|nr:histidine phosphatase family protein [Xanthomonadaceae bacterium]
MTRLFLIRHARTAAYGRVLTGRDDGVALDPQGREQSIALARRLRHVRFDALYSSPQLRARQTAEPLSEATGLALAVRAEFDEIDFGQWSGRDFAELAQDRAFQRFNLLRSCATVPGGESMAAVQARMVRGLQDLQAAHPDATVAVFGHGDPIKAALAWCAGIPLDLFQRLEISLASVSVLELERDAIRILGVNHTGDLADDDSCQVR